MEFQQVVRKRRMVRNFSDRSVPKEAVERILANALHAPSAGFSQGWAFLLLDDDESRARFWAVEWPEGDGRTRGGLMSAPVLIVPLSHKQAYLDRYAEPDKGWTDKDESRWPVPYWDIDTGFASMLMLLTAVDEGLAAVFFGTWRALELRAAFGIPDGYTPIGVIALGYAAADTPSPSLKRGRRPVADVVHRGRW